MGWDRLKRFGFRKKKEMPEGLWIRCPGCTDLQYKKACEDRSKVCPGCDHHFEMSAQERIDLLCDPGTFEAYYEDMAPLDPLSFAAKRTYRERLEEAQRETGLRDAAVVGKARIGGHEVVFGVTDPRFLRGSMGSVVGEKIARAVEVAHACALPFVFVSGSGGGARMDEGVLSLMQMAKTSAALARYDRAGGFFVSVLTNPTMGGAMASFAALGDVVIAEPGALIGFAGPTVIRNTIKVELPPGFQTSEFMLEHGFLDRVVPRTEMKDTIVRLLSYAADAGGDYSCRDSTYPVR